jgi:phytanoyl-CoA hydroxylase
MLDDAQRARYRRDGYIVLPGFKSAADMAALRGRAAEIVDQFDPGQGSSIFTTQNQATATDDYFLRSDNTIRCFFEEQAFDEHGRLRQDKSLSINKIGHALHDLDPVFERFSRGPELAALARDLGLFEARIWQSMYIFKQPGIGGEVRWHQDATFFDTTPIRTSLSERAEADGDAWRTRARREEDAWPAMLRRATRHPIVRRSSSDTRLLREVPSVTTFWFALEDATIDNGCLWVEPGGHRGPLRERFVRNGDDIRMEKLDHTPWPDDSIAVPLAATAGSLVCFHGLLPHYSAANRSPLSRHAYTLHATDSRTEYSKQNWIQRERTFPARGF